MFEITYLNYVISKLLFKLIFFKYNLHILNNNLVQKYLSNSIHRFYNKFMDTLSKDTLSKDTLSKDTLSKDTLSKDTLSKDTLSKDTLSDRQQLILGMFNKLGYKYSSIEYLHNKEFDRKIFLEAYASDYMEFIPKLKQYFRSAKLDSLHANSIEKQKFPVINIFRQMLRCCNIHMKPKVVSLGYCKATGKKRYKRKFTMSPF
jgi:hypothetical protein